MKQCKDDSIPSPILNSQFFIKCSGPEGTRTPYLVVANDALYQMSYRPLFSINN